MNVQPFFQTKYSECIDTAAKKFIKIFQKASIYWSLILVDIICSRWIWLIFCMSITDRFENLNWSFDIFGPTLTIIFTSFALCVSIVCLVVQIMISQNMFDLDRYLSKHDCGHLTDATDDLHLLKLIWLACLISSWFIPVIYPIVLILSFVKWRAFKKNWFEQVKEISDF